MDNLKQYSKTEKLDMVITSLKDVVNYKITGNITFETSITEELALDSIEIIDVLLKIREKVRDDKLNTNEEVNIDELLSYLFDHGDGDITVLSLCNFIDGLL